MTRDELIATLRECIAHDDHEVAHSLADKALVAYINDGEIAALFDAIEKWYA